MNRFSAAANFNVSADAPPSYKAQLLSVLQAQKQAGGGSAEGEWVPPEEALKQLFESMKQQGWVLIEMPFHAQPFWRCQLFSPFSVLFV